MCRYTSKEEIKRRLVDECFRRFGRDVISKQLPHVLQKLQFFHVSHALEQQRFIFHTTNTMSRDNQSNISPAFNPQKHTAEVSGPVPASMNPNSSESFTSVDENTELKTVNQERHYRRARSKSPKPRKYESRQAYSETQVETTARRTSRQRSIERVLEKQTSQQSDEVFIHNEITHQVQFSQTSQTMRSSSTDYRNDSPPPDYDHREEHFHRHPFSHNDNNDEAQPLNPKKSSSRGSDSAQGGSISSPEAVSPGHLQTASVLRISHVPQKSSERSMTSPHGSTIGSSMFGQVGSDYWKDSCDTDTSQAFVHSNTRNKRYQERCDGYPEVMEELLTSNRGPSAMDRTNENKNRVINRSRNRSMSPEDSDETKKKELYVQTVV